MDFCEIAKQVCVFGGFGAYIGLVGWSFGYLIYQLVAIICKKVKAHKVKKDVNHQDNI